MGLPVTGKVAAGSIVFATLGARVFRFNNRFSDGRQFFGPAVAGEKALVRVGGGLAAIQLKHRRAVE